MTDSSDSEGSQTGSDEELQAGSLEGLRESIYDQEVLHEKLEEIMWETAEFVDTQATTSKQDEQIKDVEDDLQRELVFYNQALAGAQQGVQTLQDKGIPWLRPPDYYAEMVKSDGHMANIKQRLVYEQKQIEEAEERRKQREAKRNSKAVQAEKLKEKAQTKKSNITMVNKLRKQRQKSGFQGELDMDAELDAMNKSRNVGPQRISQSRTPTSKKREAKNSKFGFGGRKRLKKQNDASSAADMDSYQSGRGRGRGGRGRGSAGRGAMRPGKSRRAASRGH